MENKSIEIRLPFFDGFYESVYYSSDTVYDDFESYKDDYKQTYGNDITADDFDIDFDGYKKEVCEKFTEVFANYAPSFVENTEFSEMTSPMYYNFETDKIYANITLSEDWREKVLDFMREKKDWLSKKIQKDWTSCDGFMSFMENTYKEWLDRFEDTEEEIDPRYLSTIIEYMMLDECKDIRYCIAEEVLSDVYVGNYIYCTKEKKEKE
jgi:hypothetical protein